MTDPLQKSISRQRPSLTAVQRILRNGAELATWARTSTCAVSLNFSHDGSHYLSHEEFLREDSPFLESVAH